MTVAVKVVVMVVKRVVKWEDVKVEMMVVVMVDYLAVV